MAEKLQAVRGMNDILPAESARWEALEEKLRGWLRGHGYNCIRTPVLEHTRLFKRAIGDATDIVEKEMYSFEDSLNGEHLSMRPEATAPTVRMAIEHNLLHGGPQRLYYLGPMFRHERPQRGRYRQFHQVGVEALGLEGPDIDAELLLMCQRLWKDLGISDVRLELNCLGSAEERARHREALVDYFSICEADLDDDSRRRLRSNPLRILDSKNPDMQPLIEASPRLLQFMGDDSRRHFDGLQELLVAMGIEYSINPRLVRGLDYYNLTVFEWITGSLGAQGTICGGGRYDGLFEQLGGRSTPAAGWAMGMERLLAVLDSSGTVLPTQKPDVYLVSQGDRARVKAFRLADQLRQEGLSVLQHCGAGNFKNQLRKADQSGAQIAAILGEDEVESGTVAIKSLRSAVPQASVALEQAGAAIKSALVQNSRQVST